MPRSADIRERLLRDIASGAPAPGETVPSVRTLAREEGTTPTTAARAYADLAGMGILVAEPRRPARVAPDAPALARRALRGTDPLRVAGSDDPLLDELLRRAGSGVEHRASDGSFAGLAALWRGEADAAALHLWHRDGEHNAPYAARVLAGRRPCLLRLWRREQGILVERGNPHGIERVRDLTRVAVARRRAGTGTHALTTRLLREAGSDPGALHGPEVGTHFEVALAVAAGLADAGVAVGAVADAVGLDFIGLAWEPFDLALGAEDLERAGELRAALQDPRLRDRARALGGYDLAPAGAVRDLA
jgi:putative molybdopterin biosynthesis protein